MSDLSGWDAAIVMIAFTGTVLSIGALLTKRRLDRVNREIEKYERDEAERVAKG
jgi:hypothetical protein